MNWAQTWINWRGQLSWTRSTCGWKLVLVTSFSLLFNVLNYYDKTIVQFSKRLELWVALLWKTKTNHLQRLFFFVTTVYSSLVNKACIVNLQVVYFPFSSQTFFLPFAATEITNYKDVAIYMFCAEAYLWVVAEPKRWRLENLENQF